MLPIAVEAILFDLDGTLVHTAPDLARAVNAMLVELGRTPVDLERVIPWIGIGASYLVKRALADRTDRELAPAEVERALERFKHHYAASICVESRLYPGALETLDRFGRSGVKLGCVTNKPAAFTEPLLREIGLARFLDVTVAGDSLPVKKPDP